MDSPTNADASPRRWTAIALGVLVLLIGISLGYNWWSSRAEQPASSARTVSAFLVNWQCLACSHRVEQRAGAGPRACPKCGKNEMYAAISWACRDHGSRPVFFQYNAEGAPVEVRMEKGNWIPAIAQDGGWNIKCPTCGQGMMPAETPKPAD